MLPRAALLAVVLSLTTVAACTSTAAPEQKDPGPAGITLPRVHAADADFLYHRFNQRLFSYDFAKHHLEEASDAPSFFQYEFPTPSRLYTAGDSINGGYSVIDVHDREITEVLAMPEDQGIFPLATSDTATFFLRNTYDDQGSETDRELVRFDSDRDLVPFTRVSGLVDSGAIVGSRLHYSVFDESTDSYGVWSVPVDEPDAKPRRELSDLRSGRLYTHDGRLLHADAKRILGADRPFECADLCYFHDEQDILVRIHVNKDSELSLDVIDTDNGKLIGTVEGGLDYRVADSRVTVFREGDVQHVSLAGR